MGRSKKAKSFPPPPPVRPTAKKVENKFEHPSRSVFEHDLPPGYVLLESPSGISIGGKFPPKPSKRELLKQTGKVKLNPRLVSTRVSKDAVLAKIPLGFDLGSVYPSQFGCCLGKGKWQGRNYAHQLTPGFSSPQVIAGVEDFFQFDFITDWTCMKQLIKAYQSNSQLSFLVHKIAAVGGPITIDHLDLANCLTLPNYLNLPPKFLQFLQVHYKNSRQEILKDNKSRQEILKKEAYHKLLHAEMKTPMITDTAAVNPPSSQYLRHVQFSVGERQLQVLVGSNTPVYLESGASDCQKCTIRLINESSLSPDELIDTWLDNTLHDSSKTVVYTQKAWKIEKISNISLKEISGQVDILSYIYFTQVLLNFLRRHVNPNMTYWLVRNPNDDIRLICLSQFYHESTPVFGYWSALEPFWKYFEFSRLLRYSEALGDLILEKLDKETDAILARPGREDNKENLFMMRLPTTNFRQLASQALRYFRDSIDPSILILDPDQVSVCSMPKCLAALKAVYQRMADLYPRGMRNPYSHCLEYYQIIVRDLLSFIGRPKNPVDSNFQQIYTDNLLDIVSWLLQCHDKYTPSTKPAQDEWAYNFINLKKIYAKLITRQTTILWPKRPLSGLDAIQVLLAMEKVCLVHRGLLLYFKKLKFPLNVPQVGVKTEKELVSLTKKDLVISYLGQALFLISLQQDIDDGLKDESVGRRPTLTTFHREQVQEKLKLALATIAGMGHLEEDFMIHVKEQLENVVDSYLVGNGGCNRVATAQQIFEIEGLLRCVRYGEVTVYLGSVEA